MSGGRFLLLFMGSGDAGLLAWLRLAGGMIVARGDGAELPPPVDEADAPERIVLVVPGVDVLLHWVDLPSLASAQAQAAARLLAAEVSATPVDQLHVALGSGGEEPRCMAVVDVDLVGGWIGQAQAWGYDPDHILPEQMLLLPPEEGVRQWDRDGLHIVRGRTVAVAAEPALASLHGAEPVTPVDDALVEAEMGRAVEAMAIDLRQGAFARRRRWRVDLGLVRRLAAIAGAIVAVTLLIQLALMLRYDVEARRLEHEIEMVARTALPRGTRIEDPSRQLTERLAEMRGAGLGFGPMAASLFTAVRDTPNVELSQMAFDRDGRLSVTATGSTEEDIAALARRLESLGLQVATGESRSGGGRRMAEMVVTGR